MRKTKQQEEVPSKILAKSPLNYRQRKLPGQSSAVPAIRIRQRDPNPFKLQKPLSPFESPLKDKSTLTQEQILNSAVYKQMEEEIITLLRKQEAQFQKLDEIKLEKEAEIKQAKDEQHTIKLEIWQLRNETMDLKDALQNEQQEYEKLMYELEITEQQFEDHLRMTEENNGLQPALDQQQNEEILTNQNEDSSSVE